jgi:ribosomal protein S18 acetylase RimI-like enzyme
MGAAPPAVRRAEADDLPALARLWLEFMDYHAALDAHFERSPGAADRWSEYVAGKLSDPDYAVLIAQVEELPVGYVIAAIREYPPISTVQRFGFVQDLAVTGASRRQGVGRALYDAAEQWILGRGVRQIELKVDVRNGVSRRFWFASGFAPHAETLIKRWPADRR